MMNGRFCRINLSGGPEALHHVPRQSIGQVGVNVLELPSVDLVRLVHRRFASLIATGMSLHRSQVLRSHVSCTLPPV